MRYAIYMPPNTKDLAINQTMVAYGNRQNATAFARANNSDLSLGNQALSSAPILNSTSCMTLLPKVKFSTEMVTMQGYYEAFFPGH